MAKWLKISLKVLSGFILLIMLIWATGAFYMSRNKKEVLNSVLQQLNKSLNGKISATSMEFTLLQGFPGISVSLKDVLLNDSLVAQHKHDLLKAEDIDVSLNVFSLIAGNTRINRITVNNASVYLFTDSNGYSNSSIFRKKKKPSDSSSTVLEIKRINFNHVSFIVDNQRRHKLFNFDINELNGRINYPDSGWAGTIKLNTLVKSFSFNTRRGSFLKDKVLDGTLSFQYDKETEIVTIEPKTLNIGKDLFTIGAKINLAEKSGAFSVSIAVDDILYRDIALSLAPNISSKLLRFGIEKPVDIRGNIIDDGTGKYKDPLIKVGITVRDNVVTIPTGKLTACNFDGSFTNQDKPGGIIGDENSSIKFYKLSGSYYNAPLNIDTLSINNLAKPIATGLVTSKFPLSNLNHSIGVDDFDFKKGTANLKLYCIADIDNFRFTKPIVSGKIQIADADITYLPRKLRLVKSALDIHFDQNNLSIQNGHFQLGKSELNLSCDIKNFLNLYYTDPEKILVNLKMHSPQLYLNEFLPFLGPRSGKKKSKPQNSSLKTVSKQLSNVLEISKMNIALTVNKAIYDKFIARNLNANISLREEGIFFNKINVNHAGGSLSLNGNLTPDRSYNNFKINARINRVNVKDFFYSFDNFGQKTITNKNLEGYLSSLANVSGKISYAGKILPRSMYGKVIFNLKNAALVNFEPLRKVGKFAFANRNLSDVRIDNLDGTLNIRGDKVEISPMQVSSSALNFNVKGIYGLNSGTDIAMDIPLRNPKKDEILNRKEKKNMRMKGIVLYLKAIDDEKGGIKIRWNKDHD